MPDPTVDCIALFDVPLTGTPVIDTFQTAPGSRVAVAVNTNPAENGIYDIPVGAGAWTRSLDFDAGAEMVFPARFAVRFGSSDNAGAEFYFNNRTAPVVGTDAITINRRSWPVPFDAGAGISRSIGELSLATTGVLPGQYSNISGEVDEFGRFQTAAGSAAASTFIEGLRLARVSGTTLRVGEGSAFVPNPGVVLDLAVDADLTPVLAANTTYHVYFLQSGATAATEIVTQVPAAPYRANARVKGGPDNTTPDAAPDDTRRWLGQFATDGAANIVDTSIVSAAAATEDYPGTVRLATAAETQAGANGRRAVHPVGLKSELDRREVPVGYFSAFRATDQTGVARLTPTKVLYGSVETAHPWFADTGTNLGRYTPQRAGIYDFRASASIAAPAEDQSRVFLWLYKNGAVYRRIGTLHTSGTSGQNAGVMGSVWAQANGTTDFFEVFLLHSYGTQQTISGSSETTWFQGMLARPL